MSSFANARVSRPRGRALAIAVLACCCALALARPKTSRDWGKMSDKDWDKIEQEWETDEEREEYEFKPPTKKGIDMEKLKKAKGKELEKLVADSQVSSGPTMMFATVDYPGCCNKKDTEEVGTRWAAMLRSAGMDITTYVIEDDQVLFSSNTGLHAGEIRDYALEQPECVAVEWNSKRTPGPAETPEWIAKHVMPRLPSNKRVARALRRSS